jgi:hypothetical protein
MRFDDSDEPYGDLKNLFHRENYNFQMIISNMTLF